MTSSWFLWMIVLFFLVTPVSYGWGRYIQRRRSAQAVALTSAPNAFDHHAWGVGGDFLWLAFIVTAGWAVSSLF